MLSVEKYELNEAKENELLKNAMIIFDTSALLDFYYYSDKTRNGIFNNLFTNLETRLWLPSQVYFEFCKNRKKVLLKPTQTYRDLLYVNQKNKDSGHITKIEDLINSINSNQIKSAKLQIKTLIEKTTNDDKHPFLDNGIFNEFNNAILEYENNTSNFSKKFELFKTEISKKVDLTIQDIEKKAEDDSLFKKINEIFDIGKEFTYNEIFEIVKEGKIRYENQIPPGYEDQDNKNGFQIYGDLICWKQILKYAKSINKPVILVSNDEKEDWIEECEDNIKPRFELIKEFWDETNNQFWMFNSKTFLYKMNSILDEKLENSVIDEVQEVYEVKLEMKNEINELMLCRWIESYFGGLLKVNKIKFEDNEFNEVVFKVAKEDGESLMVHVWRATKSNYTALLNPLRRSIYLRDEVLEGGKDSRFVFLVILSNEGQAKKFRRQHIGRQKVQEILKDNVRIIISYENESKEILVEYDNQ